MPTPNRSVWPAIPGLPELRAGDAVHLIGIGGAGMSGLARALASSGLAVSGCDRADSALLAVLGAEGIRVSVGHDPAHLDPPVRLAIHSPAIDPENVELIAARRAGLPITRRAELLGALMDEKIGVAVGGTHGKTTTSGLIATVLVEAGRDPSFFIGGEVADLGTNARMGSGEHLVLEADEYDRSFLHGHPTVAVVTHLEHDHPDHYPDLASVLEAFRQFVGLVRPHGRIIASAAPPAITQALEAASVPVELYYVAGEDQPPADCQPTWRALELAADPDGQHFEVRRGKESLGEWFIRLPGRHNAGNALAAIAVAEALGVDREVTRHALARFRGAARRFEVVGQSGGVVVIDDYAHHPTEVAATIRAARQRFPGRRLWAVLQPHTYTRVAAMADAFTEALRKADRVVVTPVYAAREAPLPGVDADRIAAGIPGAMVSADLDEAVRVAAEGAAPGDVLLFMGAGDINTASRSTLAARQRQDAGRIVIEGRARELGGTVLQSEPIGPFTSLRVGGPADALVRVHEIQDLVGWWELARELGVAARVIGRGTNVLVGDRGYRGLVILNRCEAFALEEEADGEHALVVAESGVTLAGLALTLARQGWAGLEAGIGIPGAIGAAVITNAGAFSWSIADSLTSIEVLEPDGAVRQWPPAELAFRYRGSALKGDRRRVVLRANLHLSREQPAALAQRISEYAAHRRATQPSQPSAGSMFRNPPGDYAGRLLDAAGLKGTQVGGAEISTEHANFFVNRGGATAADVAELVSLARQRVIERFGVRLELEIEPLGENGVD